MTKHQAVELSESKIDAIFAHLDQCRLPGVAVGVSLNGRPRYRKAYGLANMELPIALSPTMRMRIGSTTKQFTCLAYLLLCEDGKCAIDDAIGKYLPEINRASGSATIRELMTHTSGIRDAHDINWTFGGSGHPTSSDELFSFYRDIDDRSFNAGTTWRYNNGGYLLLSMAVERIAGRSLEDVLHERIFDPIGMVDTLLRRFDTDFVPNSATLHMMSTSSSFEKSYLGTAVAGEGGIVSTVDDMLRWMAHMDRPTVGSKATWTLMKTPHIVANGTSTGYGLGLTSGKYRGLPILHHAGGVMGGNVHMLKMPSVGLDITVLSNRQDVESRFLAYSIVDKSVSSLPDLEANDDGGESVGVTGVFRSPATGRTIQLYTATSAAPPWINKGQQIVSIDGGDIPFVRKGRGRLLPAGLFGELQFEVRLDDHKSTPPSIQLIDYGNVDELLAVQPAQGSDSKAILGRYRSQPTSTVVNVVDGEGGLRMETKSRFGSGDFKLECIAKGIWRARSTSSMPWGGVLTMENNGSSIRFSNLRTAALPFRKE